MTKDMNGSTMMIALASHEVDDRLDMATLEAFNTQARRACRAVGFIL